MVYEMHNDGSPRLPTTAVCNIKLNSRRRGEACVDAVVFSGSLGKTTGGNLGPTADTTHVKASALIVNALRVLAFTIELISLTKHGVNHWYQFDCDVSSRQKRLGHAMSLSWASFIRNLLF